MSWIVVDGDASSEAGLQGCVGVPGDKSISHRALMLGALAEGTSRVEDFLPSGDCLATLDCLRQLGVRVEHSLSGASTTLLIHGEGLRGLSPSVDDLDCRRSGTTMRLMAGILAGQTFDSTLTGEPQLLRRPMRRITAPLREMGAAIDDVDGHGPLRIHGQSRLHGVEHQLSVASAQVKSAILLGGLYADGPVIVHQPGPARDHTERMLAAQIESKVEDTLTYDDEAVFLDPEGIERLRPVDRIVPGDLSSAAFLLAAALMLPSSTVTVLGIGVNPTRTGLLDVLSAMGADLTLENTREQGGEPVADLTVKTSFLGGTEVKGSTVVRMIDEFPILAVVATQAEGTTVVRDAAELRVKETDRIEMVAVELRKLGAHIETQPDGFIVEGPTVLQGTEVDSHGDHRLGMALAVAGLVARGKTRVQGSEAIADSFPGFIETMELLGADISYGL